MDHATTDRGSVWDAARTSLARNWWAILLRGIAGILFGILTLVWPGATLAALVLLFGAYALVDGIFSIAAALSGRATTSPWWALVLAGLAGIAAGLVAFLLPGLTALTLVLLIGAWAIVRGVLEIVSAIRLRKEIEHEWWLALSGVVTLAFGILVMLAPGAGALAMLFWTGIYALVVGVMLVVLGLRLRSARVGARDAGMRRAA
ncbi:MAG TPA: HdeD family acid-resistance protein [Candidatus Tectomicrobia bacterium]|nr:HdeD family acid-resistance protein [Candidatus Tectomicrobia bacterium]